MFFFSKKHQSKHFFSLLSNLWVAVIRIYGGESDDLSPCMRVSREKSYVDVDRNTLISQRFFPLASRTAHKKINQRFQIFSPSDDEKSFSRENLAFHVKNVLVAGFIDEIRWLRTDWWTDRRRVEVSRKVWQQRGDHLSLNLWEGLKRSLTLRLTKFAVSSLKNCSENPPARQTQKAWKSPYHRSEETEKKLFW